MKGNIDKKAYGSPKIEQIMLDNDISLALSSAPADPPVWSENQEHKNDNPFQPNVV